MLNRTRVASLVALLAAVSLFAVAEASARGGGFARGGGGFAGGHGAVFHGGPRHFAGHPIVRHPIGNPHRVARFGRHDRHAFGHRHRNRFDDNNGTGAAYVGSVDDDLGDFGAPYYYGAPQSVAPDLPTGSESEPATQFAASGRICRVVNQMVPRERGGETAVRITRCYPSEQ